MITNLMSAAFVFIFEVWFVGMVVLTIQDRLLSIVQTENKNKWLKVLFIVCGVSLWVWIVGAAFRLVAVAIMTIHRTLVTGDMDMTITNHLIIGALAVCIVAILALFVIAVYEQLGEKRPWTTFIVCVAAGLFTVIMRAEMLP